jgi:TonB family protein
MIESDFPNTISLDGVHEFWNRAFLTYHDHPAEIVPPFWKPCFEGKQTQTNPWCHFAPKVAPLFRFAPEPETAATPASAADSQPPLAQLVAQPTPGITVPRAKYTPDPEYSEEARTEQIQGLVIINLIVDKTGNPTNIRIVSPLGYGLDEKALNSIKKWRFEPGRKDGQPVATYATVEVAFHLSR